jgi:hypothetical protein
MSQYVIELEGKLFSSWKEFGENIYLHEDAAEKLLTSPKFLRILKDSEPEMFKQLVKLNHESREFQEFMFLAQYIFNPFMNIRHHGYSFNNLKEIGDKILEFGPEIDVYLKDFLKYKLLTKYMEMMGWDLQKPIIYKKIKELEHLFSINENKSYFLLGFVLSQCDIIRYWKRDYVNIEEFFISMRAPFNIVSYSSLIDKSQYVLSWLTVKGQLDQVKKYEDIVNLVEKMEKSYDKR